MAGFAATMGGFVPAGGFVIAGRCMAGFVPGAGLVKTVLSTAGFGIGVGALIGGFAIPMGFDATGLATGARATGARATCGFWMGISRAAIVGFVPVSGFCWMADAVLVRRDFMTAICGLLG